MNKKLRLVTILSLVLVMIFTTVQAISADKIERREEIDFSPIVNQIINDYEDLYKLENFEFETFSFKYNNEDYTGINVYVDMTLIKHPEDFEYFKGLRDGVEKLDNIEKMEIEKDINARLEEIEKECYGVRDRSTFTYAVKTSDLSNKYTVKYSMNPLDKFYYRVDADEVTLYSANNLVKPNTEKDYNNGLMETKNMLEKLQVQKIKSISRRRTYYDRVAARNWALDNAYAEQEFPSSEVNGSDCANFVSKALNEGGIPEDRSGDWYRASHWGGWPGDNWFRTGHNNNGGVVPYMVDNGYFYRERDESSISAGCIMNWLDTSHVALVTYGDSVTIKYTEHGRRPTRNTVYRPDSINVSFYNYY